MTLRLLVLFVALVLAALATQNSLLRSTDAETANDTAITACAVQGGTCSEPSLDSTPDTVLEHTVFADGCFEADLHVVRYIPGDSADGTAVVATWCT